MAVTVKLPTQLRSAAGGATAVATAGETVGEALEALYAQHGELRERIAGGDWEDATVEALDKAVKEFADDFGYDLDEEGQPMDEGESERVKSREDGDQDGDDEGGSRDEDSSNGARASAEDDDESEKAEEEEAGATA